ncbi:MAG: cobalt ECF transporter T component CbiQ [Lachnospiraceae bacterium]|nr:cobalt ECF transporter T component CbiQ [Lachnospiraceae bacterium]
MSKITNALQEIESLDELARRDQGVNRIHPLVKFFVTILYLVVTVSFHRYNVAGVLSMALYPFLLFEITGLSFGQALKRLRVVLPIVCIMGIFNPFFDREVLFYLGGAGVEAAAEAMAGGSGIGTGIPVTGGVLSMLTLMIKGVLTVLSSYLLIATTTMEDICYALRRIHVPRIIVTEMLLIYRYMFVLSREAGRIYQAYMLRAPGQKGIASKAWGPLAGQLLLRSMDRAERVYDSMTLRGFTGEYPGGAAKHFGWPDLLYLVCFAAGILILRFVPLFVLLGSLFV